MSRSVTLGTGLLVVWMTACVPTVARLTDPRAPDCQNDLRQALEDILVEQEETPEAASALAAGTVQTLAEVDIGPRPFQLSSPSGVDYAFFLEEGDEACLLRLVAWQKGFVQYSNNLTYIATRPLPGCVCGP